jgi:hypothetical protein
MTAPLCQVCGKRARELNGRIGWLIDADKWALPSDRRNPPLTITPPTCHACRPLATKHSPHLRSTATTPLTVAAAHLVGVYGDLYAPPRRVPHEPTF